MTIAVRSTASSGILDIQPPLERGVRNLSGGERQRVAIARALMTKPRCCSSTSRWPASIARGASGSCLYLLRIRRDLHVPLIYVTHDQAELAVCRPRPRLDHGRVVSALAK